MEMSVHAWRCCRRSLSRLFSQKFGDYTVIHKLGNSTPSRQIPPQVIQPAYSSSGFVDVNSVPSEAEQKPKWKLQRVRAACSLARKVLELVGKEAKIGVTTDELDSYAHHLISSHGAYPSPLNYHGFPKSICTSANNVACHGIPDDRPLQNGDIVSVDVTVYLGGVHGDCCATYLVGKVDLSGQHLVRAAEACLIRGISACAPSRPFSSIGCAIQMAAEELGVTVVPCFLGHGIGNFFHEPPDIYHFKNDLPGVMLEGMTFTIEPVLAQGSEEVVILEDGWTAVMLDDGRAAQFEHTVLITCNGVEVLT